MTDLITFWGCELNSSNKENTWAPGRGGQLESTLDDSDEMMLTLSQACVGASAKENEWNVVDVQTRGRTGNAVQHTIMQLKRSSIPHCQLSILLTTEATFKLVQGNGPVHITGEERISFGARASDESDEEDVELFEQDEKRISGGKKKGPPSALEVKARSVKDPVALKQDTAKPGKKKETLELAEAEELDEEDSDDGDLSENDNDSEMEDEGEDSEDDDIEDEEDEEDEEEEQEEPPSKKKKIASSQSEGRSLYQVTKGQPTKSPLSKGKPSKQPETGKSPTSASQTDIERVKERLLKTSNVPKKKEKFHNFVKHTLKVQDEKARTAIWEWWQKQKKH